jgi:hypothetical protein
MGYARVRPWKARVSPRYACEWTDPGLPSRGPSHGYRETDRCHGNDLGHDPHRPTKRTPPWSISDRRARNPESGSDFTIVGDETKAQRLKQGLHLSAAREGVSEPAGSERPRQVAALG